MCRYGVAYLGYTGNVTCNIGEVSFSTPISHTLYSSKSIIEVGDFMYEDKYLNTITTSAGFLVGSTTYRIVNGQITQIATIDDPC